jgi:hypothetical protein
VGLATTFAATTIAKQRGCMRVFTSFASRELDSYGVTPLRREPPLMCALHASYRGSARPGGRKGSAKAVHGGPYEGGCEPTLTPIGNVVVLTDGFESV